MLVSKNASYLMALLLGLNSNWKVMAAFALRAPWPVEDPQ